MWIQFESTTSMVERRPSDKKDVDEGIELTVWQKGETETTEDFGCADGAPVPLGRHVVPKSLCQWEYFCIFHKVFPLHTNISFKTWGNVSQTGHLSFFSMNY